MKNESPRRLSELCSRARWFTPVTSVGLVLALSLAACGDNDHLPPPSAAPDSGALPEYDSGAPFDREDAETPQADAGPPVTSDAGVRTQLAPSGAALVPAMTVMSSGRFKLMGTLGTGTGTGTRSTSARSELSSSSISER